MNVYFLCACLSVSGDIPVASVAAQVTVLKFASVANVAVLLT